MQQTRTHKRIIKLTCNLTISYCWNRRTWTFYLLTLDNGKPNFSISDSGGMKLIFEPRHDKTSKVTVRPAKTQISLGIRPFWSKSSLSAWRNIGFLATHWAHSEGSDQTGRMPRLIWVFAGRTLILLVLSCPGSYLHMEETNLFFFFVCLFASVVM